MGFRYNGGLEKRMAEKSPLKTLLRRMLPGVFLGVLAFIGLALLGDLKNVSTRILDFDWRIYPAALLLTLFNYTLRFFKWHYYLHLIGIKKISIKQSARLFVAGFPLAVTPGKVGEALKGVWLNQLTGLPVARGISVVVAERVSDGLAVLILSLVGVIAYPQYWPGFLLVVLFLLAIIVISQIRPAALWMMDQAERVSFLRKTIVPVREFYEGSYTLFRPLPTFVAVSLGTISWLGEGVGFYLILLGLGMQPSIHLAVMAVFILAFSTIIGAVSALPGGLGAAEVSIAGMLAFLVSTPPALASTATLLIRLATLWFGVLLGLIVWAANPNLLGLKTGGGDDA
jgi:glycosyltransferase 2 family protein